MRVQWAVLALWLALTLCAHARGWRWFRGALVLGLIGSMGGQMALLAIDGRMTLQTAAPLHLCAVSALLCLPMLLLRSRVILTWQLWLGAPCAFFALLFPAVAHSSVPWLMRLCFFQLHALIICATLLCALAERQRGLPRDARGVFAALNGYAVFVLWFNTRFDCNFLFLARPPAGTPLAWLHAQGASAYICALELALMLGFALAGGTRARA